jgi:glycogen(starch) synthase
MHICLVSQEYPPETAHGGIGTQTWIKARFLISRGHNVDVLSCAGVKGGAALRTQNEGGIVVHRLQPPGESPEDPLPVYDQSVYMLGYSWSVLKALHHLMGKHQFDLIDFPEYGAEGFAYQLNRTPFNWVPVIVQLHGPLAMFAERIGWPERESRFCRVATFMEGESIRIADGLMACSANIADFVADFYGVDRNSIDVVHCGVDCDMFRPRAADSRHDHRPTVLFVGNIEASKGIKSVFGAVLRLRSKYPDIRLQILGKGDHLRRTLETVARKEGIEDNVEWLGFFENRKQVAEIYSQADVFASPADHEVGVANVYIEAMASGCPVIASTTGGAPEAVTDGKTGFLVPPHDVEALVIALDRLLSDSSLRQQMGLAARQWVEDYFSTDKYMGRVLTVYERAIAYSRQKMLSAE